MKKLLLTSLILVTGFLIVGCGEMTHQQQTAWMQFWQNYNDNYQRQLDKQNDFANAFNAGQVQQRNNYWQEKVARQKYLDSLWRDSKWRK